MINRKVYTHTYIYITYMFISRNLCLECGKRGDSLATYRIRFCTLSHPLCFACALGFWGSEMYQDQIMKHTSHNSVSLVSTPVPAWRKPLAWVLPLLTNNWIISTIWLYIALNRTPNIDCYWGGGSTQPLASGGVAHTPSSWS